MNNIKLIRKSIQVVDEKTKEKRNYTNFYLELPNGSYVAIKPAFKNDYKTLYVLAYDIEKKDVEPF